MEPRKQAIIDALNVFVRQRPGLEFGNYGDVSSYRSEMRSITKDLHHYRELERAVILSDTITADALLEASRSAYSGRLTLVAPNSDGPEDGFNLGKYWRVDYCTGQYWPTEYRRAACAVLASALWSYTREHCMPSAIQLESGDRVYPHCNGSKNKISAGDWLRAHFRRQFGCAIAARWFS